MSSPEARLSAESVHATTVALEGRAVMISGPSGSGKSDLALRLKALVRPGLSVNPARIDGGSPNNVVPDLAILRVNLRPATPEDEAEARRLIDEAVARVAQTDAPGNAGFRPHE